MDTNLGWKGPEKYVVGAPQMFDLWQDPQERYDITMTNWTEHTWVMVNIGAEVDKLMKTYVQYPPRKMQSLGYTGPLTISNYEKLQWLRDQLQKEGFHISTPTN